MWMYVCGAKPACAWQAACWRRARSLAPTHCHDHAATTMLPAPRRRVATAQRHERIVQQLAAARRRHCVACVACNHLHRAATRATQRAAQLIGATRPGCRRHSCRGCSLSLPTLQHLGAVSQHQPAHGERSSDSAAVHCVGTATVGCRMWPAGAHVSKQRE